MVSHESNLDRHAGARSEPESSPELPGPGEHCFLTRVEDDPDDEGATRFSFLTRMDEASWLKASDALHLLEKLYRGFNSHLRIAYDDLTEEISCAEKELHDTSRLSDTSSLRLINRALHMSVALRLYEEHAMSDIHKRWGKGSAEEVEVRRMFSIVFDRSLGYRVLHALRNALVHTTEEVVTYSWWTGLDDPDDRSSLKRSARVTVHVSRSAFGNTDVRSATRKEVGALEKDPDLLEFASEALTEVEELNAALEPYLYPDIDEAVSYLWTITREHFPTTAASPWFVQVDDRGKPTGVTPVAPVFWDYIVRRATAAR